MPIVLSESDLDLPEEEGAGENVEFSAVSRDETHQRMSHDSDDDDDSTVTSSSESQADSESTISSFGKKKVWARPAAAPDDTFLQRITRYLEDPEPFEQWAKRVRLPEGLRQDLREQEHFAKHRREAAAKSEKEGEQYFSRALGCCKQSHYPRRAVIRAVGSRLFGLIALGCILASSASLGLVDPTNDPVKDVIINERWTKIPGKPGCTYETASNYDPEAEYDDGSCELSIHCGVCGEAKMACRIYSFSYRLRCHLEWGNTLFESMYKRGCMNPEASNYDRSATKNVPGSCGKCSDPEFIYREECEAVGLGSWKFILYWTDLGLLIFFSTEMAMKLLATGLVWEPHSYLRVGWNWLDIVVVIPAWLPDSWVGEDSTLRVFRLLRPLRTINRFAGLRRLISTLLAAIPQLSGLVAILMVYFLILSITGVQLWAGRWKQTCVPAVDDDLAVLGYDRLADTSNTSGVTYDKARPTGQFCDIDFCRNGSDFIDGPCTLAGCYGTDECVKGTVNPFQFEDLRPDRISNITDIMSFDSVPDALPIVLQVFTLASWQSLMHITRATCGDVALIYFITAVIIGSYFMVQLFVAILKENFDVADTVLADGLQQFIQVDRDGSGELDKPEVMRICLNAGLYLQEEEFDIVFAQMDTDGGGLIELGEFLEWLGGGSEVAAKLRKKMSVDENLDTLLEEEETHNSDILVDTDTEQMVSSAKHKLKLLSTSFDRVDFSMLFDYYNVDGDSSLSLGEFRTAIRRDAQIAPTHMSNAEIKELFNQIDTDASGSIELNEFEDWMAIEDTKLPPLDQLLQSAMKQHIVKESCYILSIQRQGTTQDFTQVQNALEKLEVAKLVKEFALGTGLRKIHVNYQPRLKEYSVGGFRDGKHAGHSGPPVITISEQVIDPLVGHAVCFQTDTDLRSAMTTSGTTRTDMTPLAVVANMVIAAELVALGKVRMQIRSLVGTSQFKLVSVLCIVANIIVLMFDHYGIHPMLEQILSWISHVFTVVFLVELVLKGLGSTSREFWRDGFTLFEIFIVMTGLLELYADLTDTAPDEMSLGRLDTSKAFRFAKVCRSFRVLRVLRLVSAIKSMRTVVETLVATLWDLSYVLLMLGMFLYTFTVLGMQLYGAKLVEPDGLPPRANWDNFHMASFTTFQIMTLDGYDTILYNCIRLRGPWTAMYFLVWIFIGAFVLVNLLLVTILDAYAASATRFAMQEERVEQQQRRLAAWDSVDSELVTRSHQDDYSEEPYRPGQSGPLHVAHKFTHQRKQCRAIIAAPAFDNFFILLVLMNMLAVTYDTPWLDPDSFTAQACNIASAIFTVVFCVESMFKIFAGGLFAPVDPTAPEAAYIGPTNPNLHWNQLDLCINAVSIMDLIAQVVSIQHGHGRFFQTCRAFRTLRLVSRVNGLKILLKSIVSSIASLYGVIGVMMLVWLVFGLTCVTFLKGRMYRCTDTDPAVEGMLTCVGTHVSEFPDGTVGLMDRSWHNPPVHFDDIFSAMYTLFEMSSMSDWVVKARDAMDHTFLFKQPEREANPLWAYFFMMFIIVNNFFLVNLFIGVIYTKYLTSKFEGMETLTKYQKEWLDIMVSVDHVRPVKTHTATRDDRQVAFNIATSKKFEAAMMFIIICNIIVLALKHDDESATWTLVQDVLNFACTITFSAELMLKIYAFGVKGYWNVPWNRFDFLVVVTSWVDIAIQLYPWAENVDPTPFRIVRIARVIGRIARVFKAARIFPESAILIDTFTSALGGMLYVTMLIALVLFVFAVIAMNVFGKVALQGCMNEYQNFQNVWTGMLTLFGLATGDGFSCMVHSMMVSEIGKSFAIKGACSEESGTCGDSVSARIFFIFFKPIIMFTTIELFVNVVLDRYEQLTNMRAMKVTGDDLKAFVEAWQRVDYEANGTIPVARVQQVIDELNVTARGLAYEPLAGEEPISLHELRLPERADDRMSRFIATANPDDARDDPTYTFVDPQHDYASSEGMIHFHELLYGLCERKCGTPMPKGCAVVIQARAKLSKRMPTVAHIFSKISQPLPPILAPNTKIADAKQQRSMEWANPAALSETDASAKLANVKQQRSMEWANPVGLDSVDEDQDSMDGLRNTVRIGRGAGNGKGSSSANSAPAEPDKVDLAQALFGNASRGSDLFGAGSSGGGLAASGPAGVSTNPATFDVEGGGGNSSTFDVEGRGGNSSTFDVEGRGGNSSTFDVEDGGGRTTQNKKKKKKKKNRKKKKKKK